MQKLTFYLCIAFYDVKNATRHNAVQDLLDSNLQGKLGNKHKISQNRLSHHSSSNLLKQPHASHRLFIIYSRHLDVKVSNCLAILFFVFGGWSWFPLPYFCDCTHYEC